MNDSDIIKQLMNGNHLEPSELERASKLLFLLKAEIERRMN